MTKRQHRQKVLCIIGTRPEAIKMAPVIKLLGLDPQRFEPVICVTGQHREMLLQALQIFKIVPDIDLDCMTSAQSLSQLSARLFESIDEVLRRIQPDWVVAQGDTTTVFVAATCSYYHGIRFAHVEAGLRTGDLQNPFPEELNRVVADILATVCFAPTASARNRLLQGGYPAEKVVLTGNTVVDALLDISQLPYRWEEGPLQEIDPAKRLVLVTAHRRESFGASIRGICYALCAIVRELADENIHLVYPVHLNPEVRKPVLELLRDIPNISLLEPLDYVSMVQLMRRSELILTDSGGIQEEAPAFQVPVLVMRDKTERPEGIEAGIAQLVGTSVETIVSSTLNLLRNPDQRNSICFRRNPYGDGKAAERIVAELLARSKS